ncbi:MAG TPA: nickel-responsive transcriptional regulator NikR [Stellaceae bacterium]|nr:nickel-responsive transcriptional regulator NikR [Stellaceae bacterium]
MQRITVAIDDELAEAIDRVIAARGYQNRSEAIRDLARAGMAELEERSPADHEGVAALVYVYDHEGRELAKRLTRSFHDHHDLSLATMHVHLDHESCMEVAILRGVMSDIRHFAEHVISERGVRHGRLVAVPVEVQAESHAHGGRGQSHLHTHVREAR